MQKPVLQPKLYFKRPQKEVRWNTLHILSGDHSFKTIQSIWLCEWLFCGLSINNEQNKWLDDSYPVRTFNFQHKLESACANRGNDAWAQVVRGRMEFAQELHAADAVYHNKWNVNFRTDRAIPKAFRSYGKGEVKPRPACRPEDPDRADAFLKVAEYFAENDDEQITISELCNKMGEICEDPYSEKYMKKKLQTVFGDKIVITNIQRKQNVVTFRERVDKILNEFKKRRANTDPEEEKRKIIQTAAKLLLADIQDLDSNKETYPTREDICNVDSNMAFGLAAWISACPRVAVFKFGAFVRSSVQRKHCRDPGNKSTFLPLQIAFAIQLHHMQSCLPQS